MRILSVDEVRGVFAKHPDDGDRIAGRVAGRQLNLIRTDQLRAAGISDGMIQTRRRRGTLHRVHRCVYLFGTEIMLAGAAELAAVLAYGENALLRRRSALSLLDVIPRWGGPVEVTFVGHRVDSRPGIRVQSATDLPDVDRVMHRGIPIVSPALALLEFAAVATGDELEAAIAEAYALKLVTERKLLGVLERHPGRSGARALRAELERVGGPLWTASKAERVMKALLRNAGLPMPQTRVWLEGFQADFFWPELRLIVEVDGYQYHGHRYAFERDHKRDQAHKAANYEVIRFTWRNLENEPYRVVAVIAMAIGARRLDLTRAA